MEWMLVAWLELTMAARRAVWMVSKKVVEKVAKKVGM